MSIKHNKSDLKLGEEYSKEIEYYCTVKGCTVTVDCLWYLNKEYHSQSEASPRSHKVTCSQAGSCNHLRNGRCKLTRGMGEDSILNQMNIKVLENTPDLIIMENNQLIERGKPKPHGQKIWFGLTEMSYNYKK